MLNEGYRYLLKINWYSLYHLLLSTTAYSTAIMKTFNWGCIGWVWIWLLHSKPNTDLFFQKKENLNEKKIKFNEKICALLISSHGNMIFKY